MKWMAERRRRKSREMIDSKIRGNVRDIWQITEERKRMVVWKYKIEEKIDDMILTFA